MVYNGTEKIKEEDEMFMTPVAIREIMGSMKIKNSEGYDRIPQRILLDGAECLNSTLSGLFKRIYYQKSVPGQWLVSKTMPIFKSKGSINDIENYRPISNLCSSSKILEKLILKRILDIEEKHGIDLFVDLVRDDLDVG